MFRGSKFVWMWLTASAAVAAIATSAAAASFEERTCRQFQQTVQDTPRGVTPLEQLSRTSTVRLIEPAANVNQDDAEHLLRSNFGFAPSAIEAAKDFWDEIAAGDVQVFRAGGTYPLVMLKDVEGTLHCQHFVFFGGNGRDVVPIAGPVLNDAPGGLCWTAHGDLVEFGGTPLFIASSDNPMESELLAFRLAASEPNPPFCHLKISFNVEFEVSGSSCEQAFCADLQAQLPSFAQQFGDSGTVDLGALDVPAAEAPQAVVEALRQFFGYATLPLPPLRLYRTDLDNDGADEFFAVTAIAGQPRKPYVIDSRGGTFGRASEIVVSALADMPRGAAPVPSDFFHSPYSPLEEPSEYFPIVIGTTTYLARVSGGSFGWRMLDGYLLALYDLTGGRIMPTAGFTLTRVNESVRSVEFVE